MIISRVVQVGHMHQFKFVTKSNSHGSLSLKEKIMTGLWSISW